MKVEVVKTLLGWKYTKKKDFFREMIFVNVALFYFDIMLLVKIIQFARG